MKKISLFIFLVILLTGCTNKTIKDMKIEDIKQVYVAIDSYEYQIKEEKFEEILPVFEEEFTSKQEVQDIETRYKLILKSDTKEENFYIQKNGMVVKEEDDHYYQYTFEKESILDLYKKILGNDIFYGEIVLNQLYIENFEDNDVIFSIDSNEVLEITVGSYGDAYLLKQDKIDDFIDLLNQTKYFDVGNGDLMGITPVINLHFKDRQYWFQFTGIEGYAIISFSTKENIEHNDYQKFVGFELKNDDFYHLLQEIMGENSLKYEGFEANPSYEWVEKLEEGESNKQIMCERSDLDICGIE